MRHSLKATRRWTFSDTCVYNLSYHIIWCPKYRRPLLKDGVDDYLRELIERRCSESGWTIRSLEIMPDHVHLFLSVTPSDSIAQVMSVLKGGTAREMRERFPHLKRLLPAMWTRSYYVESVGHVSEKTIERFIADQKVRPKESRHSSHG